MELFEYCASVEGLICSWFSRTGGSLNRAHIGNFLNSAASLHPCADQVSASKSKATAVCDIDGDAPVIDIPESETWRTTFEGHIAVDSPQVVP